jgi:hypothetical protein
MLFYTKMPAKTEQADVPVDSRTTSASVVTNPSPNSSLPQRSTNSGDIAIDAVVTTAESSTNKNSTAFVSDASTTSSQVLHHNSGPDNRMTNATVNLSQPEVHDDTSSTGNSSTTTTTTTTNTTTTTTTDSHRAVGESNTSTIEDGHANQAAGVDTGHGMGMALHPSKYVFFSFLFGPFFVSSFIMCCAIFNFSQNPLQAMAILPHPNVAFGLPSNLGARPTPTLVLHLYPVPTLTMLPTLLPTPLLYPP